MPMIATTIINSIRVNPCGLRLFMVCSCVTQHCLSNTPDWLHCTGARPTDTLISKTCKHLSCPGYARASATDSRALIGHRSEEHTSELQSLMRISYAVFCLKKKNIKKIT